MFIPIACALLFNSPQSATEAVLQVSHVQIHRSFAGKLGTRVDVQFLVQVGDHFDTVQVGRQHSRFGAPKVVKEGDLVVVSGFQDVANQKVMADSIRIIQN